MSLGHIAGRDDEAPVDRDEHRVHHPAGEARSGPRRPAGHVLGPRRLSRQRYLTVQLKARGAQKAHKQLPETVTDQPVAVKPGEDAMRIIDVLVAKIDDLTVVVAHW